MRMVGGAVDFFLFGMHRRCVEQAEGCGGHLGSRDIRLFSIFMHAWCGMSRDILLCSSFMHAMRGIVFHRSRAKEDGDRSRVGIPTLI